jgi:uncharacterized protein (DUF885 family)
VFAPLHIDGPGDAERYLSLAADYRLLTAEIGTKLAMQRRLGILVPRPALPGVILTLGRHRDAARRLLPVSSERLAALGPAARSRFQTRLTALTETEIIPAFNSILAQFDDQYRRAAPEQAGCGQYPDGGEYYASLVRRYTTSSYAAEEVHRIGLDQVAALAERMAAARADLGFSGSEADFHASLAADRRFYAADPVQVQAVYMRHMTALKPLIGQLFRVLPRAPYGLARLAAEMEAGMTYGYYQPPTAADPVGRYMYNGSALDQRSLLTAASLIFHELAPGHHFHLARQAENHSLPAVRREATDLDAFNEGWAEYAAGLCWELGLYEDPYDAYGRLAHERFTAQRLVVDTGLGALGWTLQRAREYMRANTTESGTQIATETLRYATDLPGQALAYRIGYLEFQALREQTASASGASFDVRDFHETVLGTGALPFPVIREHLMKLCVPEGGLTGGDTRIPVLPAATTMRIGPRPGDGLSDLAGNS